MRGARRGVAAGKSENRWGTGGGCIWNKDLSLLDTGNELHIRLLQPVEINGIAALWQFRLFICKEAFALSAACLIINLLIFEPYTIHR